MNSLRRNQKGFTLIEVMVAMALIAILVMGITNLWAVVGGEFFRLTMREKAIMALNGEMERLNALYTYGYLAANDTACTTTTTVSSTSYKIFDGNASATSGDGTTNCDTTSMYATTAPTFDYGQILVYSGDRRHNMLFIDKEKNVCGSIYWDINTTATLVPENTYCYEGTQWNGTNIHGCALLTLYMQFPYRFNSSTMQCDDTIGNKETIKLKTIVGRRF